MLFIVLLFLIAILYYCSRAEELEDFPPGPKPWPVIGNLGTVAFGIHRKKLHHLVWEELRQKYGNLVGLRLGSANVVLVFGKDLIREVASTGEFDGRPGGFFYTMRSFGKKLGIVFADGFFWAQRRNIVLKYLRIFGFGTRQMEASISQECTNLENVLKAENGKPVQVNHLFDVAMVNILWGFISGNRFHLKDERLMILCRLMKKGFKIADMSGGVINYLPFLRHIMPDLIGFTELKNVNDTLHAFIAETIAEHKRTLNVKQPRDIMDAFLIEMRRAREDEIECNEEELQVVCLDLLQAGAETVANTIVFTLLYLLRHPTAQEKIKQEIANVCQNRTPVIDDRISMPYTEAFTMEVLRMTSVAPMGIAHQALFSTPLAGYTIPRGCLILLSLYNMHTSESWGNPDVFSPERFLDEEGRVVQNDNFIAFGAGRRRCIGEQLARAEIFLFLTSLLQKFDILQPEGEDLPDVEPVNGVTLSAKPFKAIFKYRE